MSSKIALVTGANKGIGFEVSRQLAKAGCTVFLGARNPALGQAAAETLHDEGLSVHFVELDLGKLDTISATHQTIESQFGVLDILVNNAAIAHPSDGSPLAVSTTAIEETFRTNVLGAVTVTQTMLPLLRKSQAGRIVNVSSGLGSVTLNGDPDWMYAPVKFFGYSASKTALNMFTVQLAYELRDTNIKVNAADPGYTATDLNHNRGTQTIPEGAAETIRLALLDDNGPTGKFFATEGPQPW